MFDTLSEGQRKVVFEKEGKFVVRACPGSGKTYSVAARLAHRISKWSLNHQGIATISFTNAAWQEIERQVTTHFKIRKPIPYPHFIGTIDSFVNKFIFLPYGHLVIGCQNRPMLVGEPHGNWLGNTFSDSFFPNLTYDINGVLYPIDRTIMPKNWHNNKYITTAKQRLLKAGYANQDDANYFGMKILEHYPKVAKAIIHRFPLFMVDEAQDTSEIQMKIIDLLIDNGLENIMLVGDPDQAIFEWHDAKPHLFINKYKEWKDNSIILNENRRSSQNICNSTYRLSTLQDISIAIDEKVKECKFIPLVRTYDIKKISELICEFKGLCADYDIDVTPENVAVIFRSKNLYYAITGLGEIDYGNQPWETDCLYSKEFAKSKYLFCNGEFREGFSQMQDAIISSLTGCKFCSTNDLEREIEKIVFVKFRKNMYDLMKKLPDTNCTIGEWIDRANTVIKDNKLDIVLKIKNSQKDMVFDELFRTGNKNLADCDYQIGTIHSVKGETFEAVLVILKQKGVGKLYKTLLRENVSASDDEELRIVYVGITRARRILMIAVPDEENKIAWEARLFNKSKEC
jgi:superfamily I DNA/RNA helicase